MRRRTTVCRAGPRLRPGGASQRLVRSVVRLAAFGVARFDRERGMRVPVHSLAGLLQVDFRMPGSTDYTTLLRATRLLTRDEREVEGLCACRLQRVVSQPGRSSKNFAWRLRAGSALAIGARIRPDVQPRTDGTASHGCVRRRRRGGTGSLAAAGQGGGVGMPMAKPRSTGWLSRRRRFAGRAEAFPIRRATVRRMSIAIAASRARIQGVRRGIDISVISDMIPPWTC